MIKFTGEVKNGNGSRSAKPAGYRCSCQKCSFHDEHPELVGRPLTPAEFLRVNPPINGVHVPTDYGPEVTEAWAQVEIAQVVYAESDRVWEAALNRQSRERLKGQQSRWSPTVMLPNGNVVPNPSLPPPVGTTLADEAVAVAKDARDEAGEKLRLATTRHSSLIAGWEYRQRTVRDEAEQERHRQAEVDKKAAERAKLRTFLAS